MQIRLDSEQPAAAISPKSKLSPVPSDTEPAVLPFDPRSREERLLKLAGYSDEQIAKLLERGDALRRAA